MGLRSFQVVYVVTSILKVVEIRLVNNSLKVCPGRLYVQYSQDLITGRPITGKSRHPDRFEFGY
jgi:hypothetical protein